VDDGGAGVDHPPMQRFSEADSPVAGWYVLDGDFGDGRRVMCPASHPYGVSRVRFLTVAMFVMPYGQVPTL
jgi:hypothetical protein